MSKGKMKIVLCDLKEPDVFGELIDALDLTDAKRQKYFEFSEYASIELVVDSDLKVVGGRFLPVK